MDTTLIVSFTEIMRYRQKLRRTCMPKAKPVSLWPLSFDDALRKVVGTPPPEESEKPRKKRKAKRAA